MHEGHRSRLTAKVLSEGALYEHELLEVLLFNACPRKDLNACAHALIARFGSIEGVLSASERQLVGVEGVGINIAKYLCCLGKCLNRLNGCASFAIIKSTEQFVNFLSARERGSADAIELFMLDKDGRVRRIFTYRSCGSGRAEVERSALLTAVSVSKPYGVFAAYMRGNCDCAPESADDELYKNIAEACGICGTRLYDFCIAGADGGIFSYFVADRSGGFDGH